MNTTRKRTGQLVLTAALGVVCSAAIALGDDERADVEGARAALEKWVETRRIISKERNDWALGKEMLSDRIELVQRESESLTERIAEAKESIAEADKKRVDLQAENEQLKQASAALRETITGLEARTKQLLARLPDPIRERVKPLSQRLPEDPDETKKSLSERFQDVVGILNEVNRFHREITVTSEVRELEGGETAEVTALYVGLGQGWFVTGNGEAAGVGTSTDEGWAWTSANGAAEAIALAIAILENEEVADFVQLPFQVDGLVTEVATTPEENP